MTPVVSPRVAEPVGSRLADFALALLLASGAALELTVTDISAPPLAKVAAALLPTLPLALRSVWPVVAVVASVGGYGAAIALGLPAQDTLVPTVAPGIAAYTLGARANARGLIAGAALSVLAYAAGILASDTPRVEIPKYAAAIGVALLVGRAVRALGFETDELEARAARLEHERDDAARAAVAAERARIARELHDVVGHSVSLMGVQAGAVRRRLTAEQRKEREVLLAVERTGRDAVAELSRLLDLMRGEDDDDRDRGAIPALARAEDLIAEMRRAGLDVHLEVEGEFDDVAPGRALAAFRILQEALTNALKHAPSAHVQVRLLRAPDAIEVDVVDDGKGHRPPRATSGGHGLVGMRERVALYGGSLDAGARSDGGFGVHARVPTGGP